VAIQAVSAAHTELEFNFLQFLLMSVSAVAQVLSLINASLADAVTSQLQVPSF